MANLTDHKTVSPPFANTKSIVRVEYDFANDAGATGALTALTADGALVITGFYVKGITELDSAADGTSIDIGINGGDTDVLVDGVAEATFAAGAIVKPTIVEGAPNVYPLPLALADGGKIDFEIVDEDLTSGKCEMVFEIGRP
jgi:hypothetical protein